jgi:tyrosyl-tRNA synthetase
MHASLFVPSPHSSLIFFFADMLMGLKEGQEKMSKSDPDSAIFMEDTAEEVKRKIKKAYCPPGQVAGNPCLDWIKHIVFGKLDKWTLKRSADNGGDITYETFDALAKDFETGALHPGDVKANLTDALNGFLEPVRKHFASGEPKKLLEQVQRYKVTR